MVKALAPASASLPALIHVLVDADGSLRVTAPAREMAAALKAVQGFNRVLLTLHLNRELRLSAEEAAWAAARPR